MKFQRIIEAIYYQPWSIMESGWWDIHRIVKPHIEGANLPENVNRVIEQLAAGGMDAFMAKTDKATDFFGEPLPQMEFSLDGKTAYIPVNGPLIHHATLIDNMCGACSYDDIKSDVKAAINKAVERVEFRISSPGGMATGMGEAAKAIAYLSEIGIKTKAVSDTVIGSAAYGLACACNRIEITESTIVGSIGSFTAILDSRKAAEMQGYSVEVFKSGEYKGAGVKGTSLTDRQREMIQATTNQYGEIFRDIVRDGRPQIDERDMQGQAYVGSKAVELGFADKLVDEIED